MNILLVGIGGIFGALSRFELGRLISRKAASFFPLATFLINISGAIALGVLTGIKASSSVTLLLGDGFLGAYTTFSTFMYEGFHLMKGHEKLNALIYISASLILGILGFFIGLRLGGLLSR